MGHPKHYNIYGPSTNHYLKDTLTKALKTLDEQDTRVFSDFKARRPLWEL